MSKLVKILKGRKLIREIFNVKEQVETQIDLEDVYNSIIADWEWNEIGLFYPRIHFTSFYAPCDITRIEDWITDYFDEIPFKTIAEIAKSFGVDVVEKYKENLMKYHSKNQVNRIVFKVHKTKIFSAYTKAIEAALKEVSLYGNVETVFPIEEHGRDEIMAGVPLRGSKSVIEYLDKYYRDTYVFKELARRLDIDGPRLSDERFLLQIALYIGAGKILGYNFHNMEETEEEVEKLMDEVKDWLEEEFKKNARVSVLEARFD